MKRKPGVIFLPVSALFIIFIVLLVLLVNQIQGNNRLALEYRASKLINLMLDYHVQGDMPDPASIDRNILGYGVYAPDGKAVYTYGTAPQKLPENNRERGGISAVIRNRSIVIIRNVPVDGPMMWNPGPMAQRMLDMHGRRPPEQPLLPALRKYQSGVYLEYSNSRYIAEHNLIILITFLFLILFGAAAVMVYRLYRSNRRLHIQAEHDRQLVQLGEAARTLAHEIKNPLGTLKIQRDLLLKKLPGEYSGSLDIIDRELKRLNMLVDRVGEFLRNPEGRPENVDMAAFLDELYGSREDVSLKLSGRPVYIIFDRDRLRTVLDNIVNNAVDSGGRAELVLRKQGAVTELEVLDEGMGFSPEALERLYDPFFTTKTTGTGLGLSVVKRLMDSAGSRIELGNRKEGGAFVLLSFVPGDSRG